MGKYDRVYKRDGWRCRYCKMRDGLHPHHVVYRSHQGSDELNNLITLCASCHRGHHDGKLLITVVSVMDTDLVVKFERKGDWKP